MPRAASDIFYPNFSVFVVTSERINHFYRYLATVGTGTELTEVTSI